MAQVRGTTHTVEEDCAGAMEEDRAGAKEPQEKKISKYDISGEALMKFLARPTVKASHILALIKDLKFSSVPHKFEEYRTLVFPQQLTSLSK